MSVDFICIFLPYPSRLSQTQLASGYSTSKLNEMDIKAKKNLKIKFLFRQFNMKTLQLTLKLLRHSVRCPASWKLVVAV